METDQARFVGISTTGGAHPFHYAVVDQKGELEFLGKANLEQLTTALLAMPAVIVAINAPAGVNRGLVRRRMEEEAHQKKIQVRGADLRVVEEILRQHGIQVGKTPSRVDLCPAWVRLGFILYQKLHTAGFAAWPVDDAPRQWLETHPHAVYCTLLQRQPLPALTLEGRMQRQLALVEAGLRIQDPLTFFEEVTRYRLLTGNLPWEWIYSAEQLDVLAAALVAWKAAGQPDDLIQVGDPSEGLVTLPVPALQEKYE